MAGPTITFTGAIPNDAIDALYASARAFIFPGIEDFGIAPLESMASGLPVIAYAAGGALETVLDGQTGILFHAPTVDALAGAVARVESGDIVFEHERIRAQANLFTRGQFQRRLIDVIRNTWASRGKPPQALEGALAEPAQKARAA
jgi:glycosyltransferase involved in cell wall biosynthesis